MTENKLGILRLKILRDFGVAPWSEEAEGLTDEMCLEYAALLYDEEENGYSESFNETEFFSARQAESYPWPAFREAESAAAPKSDVSAMSDYIERELRRRDTGFITY